MSVKLRPDNNLEFLSLKGGCTGSSESTLVKMPHCWKSHVMAHIDQGSVFLTLRAFLAHHRNQMQRLSSHAMYCEDRRRGYPIRWEHSWHVQR